MVQFQLIENYNSISKSPRSFGRDFRHSAQYTRPRFSTHGTVPWPWFSVLSTVQSAKIFVDSRNPSRSNSIQWILKRSTLLSSPHAPKSVTIQIRNSSPRRKAPVPESYSLLPRFSKSMTAIQFDCLSSSQFNAPPSREATLNELQRDGQMSWWRQWDSPHSWPGRRHDKIWDSLDKIWDSNLYSNRFIWINECRLRRLSRNWRSQAEILTFYSINKI